jgi:hypothetical protein
MNSTFHHKQPRCINFPPPPFASLCDTHPMHPLNLVFYIALWLACSTRKTVTIKTTVGPSLMHCHNAPQDNNNKWPVFMVRYQAMHLAHSFQTCVSLRGSCFLPPRLFASANTTTIHSFKCWSAACMGQPILHHSCCWRDGGSLDSIQLAEGLYTVPEVAWYIGASSVPIFYSFAQDPPLVLHFVLEMGSRR